MACLLQRITSMKLQNNWYVWQISLRLYIIFVPPGIYSCQACTESLHLSRLAATVFAKKKNRLITGYFLPRLPSCFCPFLFNCLPPGGFWSSSSSFSFWCPSHCYVAVIVLVLSQYTVQSFSICATSPLFNLQIAFMSALSSSSSVLTW